MKSYKIIYLLLAVAFVSTSCREKITVSPGPEKSYEIKLGLKTEVIAIDEQPLTSSKAPTENIYAVQISKKETEAEVLYQKYAYGVFDDQSLIKIPLPAGLFYKVEVTMVPNGKTLIGKNINSEYRAPFSIHGGESPNSLITNAFEVTSSKYLQYVNMGRSALSPAGVELFDTYDRPNISRFYGVVENFNPSQNTTLPVDMKWVVFGLTIIPEGLTEGTLWVEMEGAPKVKATMANPTLITKKIFSLANSSGIDNWHMDTYKEKIPMTITWEKTDGSKTVVLDQTDPSPIEFKRKTERIIRVKLGAASSGGGMQISKEEESLAAGGSEVVINQ